MDNNLLLHGMVLSAMPIGEYDKRISILTKERGKISAFSKGARRPNSSLLAASNPFVYGSFEVYQGRSSYTVHKVDVSNYFDGLKNDLEAVWYASYFMEMAEYFGQENNDESERLKLLYATLRALESKKFSKNLVRIIYELKTMAINGDYPNVFACLGCGSTDNLDYFSMERRGCVCMECHEKEGGFRIQNSVLYAMQFIISTPVEKLFTFRLTESVENQLDYIVTSYRRRYMEHEFKSESFLHM